MRRRGRLITLCSAGALLLAACASDAPDEEPPPIGGEEPDAPDPEPVDAPPDDDDEQDEPADPYAVPDDVADIDEDYVKLVVDRLLEVRYEALVTALSQDPGHLEPEAVEQLLSSADGINLEHTLEDYQHYAREQEQPTSLLPPDEMRPQRITPRRLLHAEPERCVVLAGWWDQRGTATEPGPEDEFSVFSLSRADAERVDEEINPTPWQLRDIVLLEGTDGEQIPESEWSDMDYGDGLDHTCRHLE